MRCQAMGGAEPGDAGPDDRDARAAQAAAPARRPRRAKG